MTSPFFDRVRFTGTPHAHPDSVFVQGNARFTVLTPRLLRLEWAADGHFDDRPTFAFPSRHNPPGRLSAQSTGKVFTLDTGSLVLRYSDGAFNRRTLSITLDNGFVWLPDTAQTRNLRGTRRTLDMCADDAALGLGILSRDGWALHDDSAATRFSSADGWVEAARDEGSYADWYFFAYGNNYLDALHDYQKFGGGVPLIPRFVLGAWWSRYWAYSEQELRALVQDFQQHELPLDVLVIDMDWHTPDHWTGYTWDKTLFPDPPGFLCWVHEQGLRATLNLHPAGGVMKFEAAYPRFAEAMGLDPAGGDAIPFRASAKRFMQHYFELLHHPLEEQGVDFWWMDWQQGATSELRGLDPLPWLNHLHFRDSARRGLRSMLYSRWGGLGNHRYPIGFSGDTFTTWGALQFQPYMTATAANVLYGWWSHDIGGHMGAPLDPELYVRWVQYGALSPVLRLHSTKDALQERRPWAFTPEALEAARAAFHFRYQLVPYLYTMARVAHDTGIALCRPLYYEFPDAEDAYVARDQYMLGSDLLAAPVMHPRDPVTGLAPVDVWIPPGMWIEYTTGETFTGPCWVRLACDLNAMPLFVRGGAVIPLAHPAPTTDAQPRDRLIVQVFPGDGKCRVYDDDGVSPRYLDGEFEWTTIEHVEQGGKIHLHIHPRAGKCPGLPATRAYTLWFEGITLPRAAEVDGETVDFDYDPETLRATLTLPPRARDDLIVVVLTAERALGEAHNSRVQFADVARLLRHDGGSPLSLDALVQHTHDDGAAWHALQRLGAPFVHIFDYTTPEEAGQTLGRVLVSAPPAGETLDVHAVWTLDDTGGRKQYDVTRRAVRDRLLLDNPFALKQVTGSGRWQVDVTVTWRGKRYLRRHESGLMRPSPCIWRVLTYPQGEAPFTLEQFANPGDPVHYTRPWQEIYQTPERMANIHDAFDVHLGAAEAGTEMFAATTLHSPDERDALLVCYARTPLGVWVNGEKLPLGEPLQSSTFRSMRQTPTVRLRKGANSIALHNVRGGDRDWHFVVMVFTPGWVPMPDVHYTTH